MKRKGVFENSVFGIIGALVFWQLYSVMIAFVFVVMLNLSKFHSNFIFYKVLFLISIAVIIAGFIFGIRSRKRKNLFYKIFNPNKNNLLLALAVSILLISYLYVSFGFHRGFIPFPIKVLMSAVVFFPFSALLLYTLQNKGFLKKYAVVAIVVIILLSPPVLQYSSSLHKVVFHKAKIKSCGAYVYGFMENAPAQAAGMTVGEVIKEIDGKEIKSLWDIKDITYLLTESKELTVVTDKGTYAITTVFDPVKNKQRIGTNVKPNICGKKHKQFFQK